MTFGRSPSKHATAAAQAYGTSRHTRINDAMQQAVRRQWLKSKAVMGLCEACNGGQNLEWFDDTYAHHRCRSCRRLRRVEVRGP